MHGPRWGSPEDELRREYVWLNENFHHVKWENHVLHWLLAEARWYARRPMPTDAPRHDLIDVS